MEEFHLSQSQVSLLEGKMFHFKVLRKRSTMIQLNVLAATAENEEQQTLRKKIYIAFQNFYPFL